ncbi:MAG: double-strand break repair helicase AddA [Bdellovibrionales bacterium]
MSGAVRKSRDNMPDPNVVQRRASDPTASVWVGASAGSGKTTVLVRRVLRLLLAGVKPNKILCLTFTRAAAAEMANRIAEVLGRWAICSDDQLRDDFLALQDEPPAPEQFTAARRLFARVLACPGGMRMRTIHAFCQEILRRFPIEAGLPPHFTVIEETSARALREDIQAQLLRDASAKPESPAGRALRFLVRDFGEHGFSAAMHAVLDERAQLAPVMAGGGVDMVIRRLRARLGLMPDETEQAILAKAVDDESLNNDIPDAARLLEHGTKLYAARGRKMSDWLALPPEDRAAAFAAYRRCFFTEKDDYFKNYADKKLLSQYPDLDAILRGEAERLQRIGEKLEAAKLVESTEAILTLGIEMTKRLETAKTAQALLDYDDLVIRADRLLRRPGIAPWVLYKLDEGLDHILVDEAQDTSRAQWDIVAALAEEFFSGQGARDQTRTLFVVGDEKQSIFSFQNADPEAFMEMHDFFRKRIESAEKKFLPVPLHMSFRSAPMILKAVDAIFSEDRARAGVSHEPVIHYAVKRDKIGRVEVWPLLPAAEREKPGGKWTLPLGYDAEHDPQAELAKLIAGRIRRWRIEGEILPGENRPVVPGDIMILLRRRGRFADLMVRALKDEEVPVTGVDRMKLVKQLAVMDLLALMQFALLPEDDLNLATVLRSPLVNFSEEQLMDIAIGRDGSLWNSLQKKAEAGGAFGAAADYLRRWLGLADYVKPFVMLSHMLNEPCLGSAVSGRQALWSRLGPDALDPVDELLSAAQEFCSSRTPSLQSFLQWLTASDTEIKRELDQGGGQVRIMTVHAAKGLEAPIVFLPDTADVPRVQDMPKLLWDDSGIPLYLARRPSSGIARHVWDQARRNQMEEYRRLFYVALTRAANRLYICGWAPTRSEGESAEESWYALASQGLKGLHDPHAPSDGDPQAEIVLADPFLSERTEEKPVAPTAGKIAPLPAWAFAPAPQEVMRQTLAPSRLAAEAEPPAASPDQRFARGIIIHRLLESLPEMEDAIREAAASRYLANPQHHLTPNEQSEIRGEILRLLRHPDYAPLFGPESRAEVPVSGWLGGQPVAGQIDRLWVGQNAVHIVDYKSNRPPPPVAEEVAPAYIRQLAAYRAVLKEIYPGKPIYCFLLWTYEPRLMPIPEKMLGNA